MNHSQLRKTVIRATELLIHRVRELSNQERELANNKVTHEVIKLMATKQVKMSDVIRYHAPGSYHDTSYFEFNNKYKDVMRKLTKRIETKYGYKTEKVQLFTGKQFRDMEVPVKYAPAIKRIKAALESFELQQIGCNSAEMAASYEALSAAIAAL